MASSILMSLKRFTKQAAFTLIELLTVLMILGILATLTVSSLTYFIKKSQQDLLSSELLAAIHLARSEAILRHTTVSLCGSLDQKTCSQAWQHSFIVTTPQHMVHLFHALPSQGILHWRSFPLNQQHIDFLPSGMSHTQNGSFWFCHLYAAQPVWAIMLAQSGRARIIYPDKLGNIYDTRGVGLPC